MNIVHVLVNSSSAEGHIICRVKVIWFSASSVMAFDGSLEVDKKFFLKQNTQHDSAPNFISWLIFDRQRPGHMLYVLSFVFFLTANISFWISYKNDSKISV